MGSRALVADSAETWVCSYLSLALLLGVGLKAAFGWWWADPVGAIAMLPVIVWQGWERPARRPRDRDEASRAVRPRKSGSGLWWLALVLVGMFFYFASAYGSS